MQTSVNQGSLRTQIGSDLLKKIALEYGTPVYVYDKVYIDTQCREFLAAIQHRPLTACYAVKANGNISLLREIFAQGFGADVVSWGEFARAIKAECAPDKIVFSGVGKSKDEIGKALEYGLLAFNVESLFELIHINECARNVNKKAPICLRINPNIDAKTNPYIATGLYETKFGLAEEVLPQALDLIKKLKHIELIGIACHIGSQITDLSPLKQAVTRMTKIIAALKSQGLPLSVLDMGGGLGISYGSEEAPALKDYGAIMTNALTGSEIRLVLEPGRVIAGNGGVLLTRVIGAKATATKRFVVVDAAMTELIRPCLYEAFHDLSIIDSESSEGPLVKTDIVGPVCETSDFLVQNRLLPDLSEGDLLAVHSCGAYAASMGSNYNTRPRPPEVLVSDRSHYKLIRRRENIVDIWRNEEL